jgi:hypothetical protein
MAGGSFTGDCGGKVSYCGACRASSGYGCLSVLGKWGSPFAGNFKRQLERSRKGESLSAGALRGTCGAPFLEIRKEMAGGRRGRTSLSVGGPLGN